MTPNEQSEYSSFLLHADLGPRTRLTLAQRQAIIAALRHCQGMGHPLPLTEAELDALCKRLGEQQ